MKKSEKETQKLIKKSDKLIKKSDKLYEDLGSWDSLKLISYLLDNIINDIWNNIESEEDIKDLERLNKSCELIKECLERE